MYLLLLRQIILYSIVFYCILLYSIVFYCILYIVHGPGTQTLPPPSLYLTLFFLVNMMPKLSEKLCYSSDFMLQVPVNCNQSCQLAYFLTRHLYTKSALGDKTLDLQQILLCTKIKLIKRAFHQDIVCLKILHISNTGTWKCCKFWIFYR